MRILALAGMILAGLTNAASAANPPATAGALYAQVVTELKKAHVPGAQIALIEHGNLTFVKSYGYADTGKKIPVTDGTVFRAGSISKSFTSIAIMTAVEQNKLSLDAKLSDIAPQVHFVNPWEKTNPVRLVNLLEHTTGWPDISLHILNLNEKNWSVLRGVQESSADFVSRWQPGYFTVYNNAGPAVAAVALEKATGHSFEDYMNAHVLRPMGMATADFDLPPALAARIAKSYAPDGTVTPYQYIVLKPAGSLNTSARELAQLVRLMLGRGTVDGHQILTPASVDRIERSESNLASPAGFTEAYALGNAPFPESGIAFRGHNGQIDSFTAVEGYNTRCDCGYVVMANGGDSDAADFGTPVSALIESYLTRGMKMAPPPAAKVPVAVLENYAGFYRTNTPPNSLTQPFTDVLNVSYVGVDNGKLRISALGGANEYVPVSSHLFRRTDREAPGMAFVKKDGETYRLTAFNAAQKMALWQVILGGLTVILILTLLPIALLVGITWLVLLAMRRTNARARLGLRLAALPIASFVALAATFGMTLYQVVSSGTSAIAAIASPTPYALAILVFSVLFPVFAVWGLWTVYRSTSAYTATRAYYGAVCSALIVASVYAASVGWVGVRIWTM